MKRVLLQLALLLTVSINVIAQTHTVTGKVVDESGQALSGSEITVTGVNVGTVADENGDWILEVPDGRMIFFITALGYNSRTVEDSSQFILVKLQSSSKEQDATISTAFAIKKDKIEVGYNAVTINNDDITASENNNLLSAIKGKITGANISSTNSLGSSGSIVLRGYKSFLKDNNAILVVDGVIINNYQRNTTVLGLSNLNSIVDFGNGGNDINPDDVESVTILGGAAAATLYGSAGANGAVIITTKSGKPMGRTAKMEITYKMDYSQSQVSMLPNMQHLYGQGDVYNGNTDFRNTNMSWGLPFDGNQRPWGQIILGKQKIKPYSDLPNNISSFFNYGNALNNYLSLKGGTETSTYFLSINAVNSTSVIPNNFFNRYNVRFNATKNFSNNFYSSVNFNYQNRYSRSEWEGNGGPTGNGGVMNNLLNIPRDIPVIELSDLNNKFNSMNFIDQTGAHRYGYFSSAYANPYYASSFFDNRNISDRVTGDVKFGFKQGQFDIFDRIGIDVNSDRSFFQTPQYLVTAVDQTGSYPGNAYLNTSYTSNGGYAQAYYSGMRFYNDLIGNYNHAITRDWGLNVLAGTSTSLYQDAIHTAVIDPLSNGLQIPDFYNFSNGVNPVVSTNNLVEHRAFGIFADVRFNYLKDLYFDITGRTDWSSTFNYYTPHYYPGCSLSWIFTERLNGPIKDKVLNYGKIRFSAAGAGGDAVTYANNNAGFGQLPIANANSSLLSPYGILPLFQIQRTIGDQNLKPELTREYEVGTDLSFLKDRLRFSFTYYNAYTYNLISAIPIAPSSGFSYNFVNIGDVTNRGEEVSIKGTPILTRWKLRWDLFVGYTHNVNNVASISNNQQQIVLGSADGMEVVAAKDHPLGTFYGADIAYYQNPKDGTWHPIVDPNTGLPVATKKPVYRGSFQPAGVASWGTDLSWDGLKLHVLFTTNQGGQFYSHDKQIMDANGTAQETIVNNRKPLVWANSVYQVGTSNNYVTNTTKYLPYDYFVNEIGGNKLPAQNLLDASYVKLQEISLSYRIPRKYYGRSPFGGLEAGFYANNLFIWTPRGNHYNDPEIATLGLTGSNLGINYTAAPPVKIYGLFVKVTF